jgi:CRP-like cAMP-binding protein
MKPERHDSDPTRPVLLRLNSLRPLSAEAEIAIAKSIRPRIVKAAAGQEILSPGDPMDHVRIILSGWLARYNMLEDGRRQVVSFILPGDTCDAFGHLLHEADHSIVTLTVVTYAELDRKRFEELIAIESSLAEAFWCETLVSLSIAREWIVNVGRRVALERVAHLLCEIVERLRCVDLLDGNTCAFPITQMDLADATGLSIVHLNRTLQELRGSGLIVLRDRSLTVMDAMMLQTVGMFQRNYLHQR